MRNRTGYGSCVTVGADPEGLHLSMLFLFRFGHPRVFIPWSDVSLHEGSRHGVAFHFARAPKVPLILSKHVTASLAEASAGGFEYQRSPCKAAEGGRK